MSESVHPRAAARLFEQRAKQTYRMCVRCIMDTSDPEIEFDASGVCHHCRKYDAAVAREVVRGKEGMRQLMQHAEEIREAGRGKRYDCVLGLSGGVDSSFVAYLAKRTLKLRPLAVHMDNGWNSEIAVRNIENIVKVLDLDLHTEVLDWEEFRRLQLAFLRAGTPDSEIPTDHAIVSTLLRQAQKNGVRWIMDGSNLVTELMVPETWSHGHADWRYIHHLNDAFGGAPLRTYPHYTYFDIRLWYPRVRRIRRFFPLNYVDYNKLEAMRIMRDELDWQPYGGKHYESIYTRFYQGYMLPQRFNFDKRRPHLSCLVNAGLMTRTQALEEIEKPAILPTQLAEDRAFVIKKLGVDEAEFERIMTAELKTFWDYPSYERDRRSDPVLRTIEFVAYGAPAALRWGLRQARRAGRAPAQLLHSRRPKDEQTTRTG
jgi:N-acetyl sugar amidotransferase